MRVAVLALALFACSRGKSKLDEDRGDAADVLWDLAPDQTELGIVATPRAVGLGFRAIAAAREAIKQPDFELVKPQLDAFVHSMMGSETASPEDAGFSSKGAFAMFVTNDGVLGVMPIGDREKFMASKHGKHGSAEDTIEDNTCRQLGTHYVCATDAKLFDRIGKGKLRGVTKPLGVRGDAELYMSGVPLLGQNKGELMLAAEIEPGQIAVHGRWMGALDGPLVKVAGVAAPQPDTKGASGFVSVNLTPVLANVPAVPIAGGVTLDQLTKSLAGSLTVVTPSGSVDLQVAAPLTDPKPAQTIVDNCEGLGSFFKLADKQTPGACRIVMQGTTALELDIWVEGNALRLGAHKGPAPVGKPGAVTAFGRELSTGTWTAVTWGRGAMHNASGIAPATEAVPPELALSVHAMALITELGAAARVDANGVSFRGVMRTVWANPPEVADKVLAISGSDIASGKATALAQAIANGAPTSPFAADFAAAQGGLIVPIAITSMAAGFAIGPAIMRMFGGGAPEESPTGQPPMTQSDLVTLLLHAYTDEAYPKWKAEHAGKKCPAKLDELATYLGAADPDLPVKLDPWGQELVIKCDAKTFTMLSLGPDGKADTDDDIRVSAP